MLDAERLAFSRANSIDYSTHCIASAAYYIYTHKFITFTSIQIDVSSGEFFFCSKKKPSIMH